MVIESNFVGSFGILKLKAGHIKAKISKLGISFGVGLDTQEAVFEKGTGKEAGEELAPAISLLNFEMKADSAESDITVTGSWEYWITSKLVNLFKKVIFTELIKEVEKIVPGILENKINDELHQYGSHYNVDGLGFDYSQMKKA